MLMCLMCKEIKESDLTFSKINQVNRLLKEHLRGSSIQEVATSPWNDMETPGLNSSVSHSWAITPN